MFLNPHHCLLQESDTTGFTKCSYILQQFGEWIVGFISIINAWVLDSVNPIERTNKYPNKWGITIFDWCDLAAALD